MERRMTELNSSPHALVLSGGGAYAAYEIGVMKALFCGVSPATCFVPMKPLIFTGTSAGAYNASFMVSQDSMESLQAVHNLESVWLERLASYPAGCGNGVARYRLDPSRIFNPECFFSDPVKLMGQFTDDVLFLSRELAQRALWFAESRERIEDRVSKVVDLSFFLTERLGTLIPQTIPFQNIPSSSLMLRIAVTNWSSGELEIISNAEMADHAAPLYVQASAATPGVFPPVTIDSEVYVDGGVLMNTPLQPAIDAGAETLHVVYMDPDPAKIPLGRLKSTLDTIERIWAIQNAQALNFDIDIAARVNRGLEALRNPEAVSDRTAALKGLVRIAGHFDSHTELADALTDYKQVTIHRYHPDDDLGGFSGFLLFERQAIESLVRRGYQDAVNHDCSIEGCIGPNGEPARPVAVRGSGETPALGVQP
jgi:predicted acylesterase/phospholipase RssA